MKLKDTFITHMTGDRQILLSTDTKVFAGLVKSNETAAFIINLLKEDISKEDILRELKKEYHGEEKDMIEDIEKVLAILSKIGALDE